MTQHQFDRPDRRRCGRTAITARLVPGQNQLAQHAGRNRFQVCASARFRLSASMRVSQRPAGASRCRVVHHDLQKSGLRSDPICGGIMRRICAMRRFARSFSGSSTSARCRVCPYSSGGSSRLLNWRIARRGVSGGAAAFSAGSSSRRRPMTFGFTGSSGSTATSSSSCPPRASAPSLCSRFADCSRIARARRWTQIYSPVTPAKTTIPRRNVDA